MPIINNLPRVGSMNITTLWTGSLSTNNSSATLSDNPFNYKVIYIVWLVAGAYQRVITLLPNHTTDTNAVSTVDGVHALNNYGAYVEVSFTSSQVKVTTFRHVGWGNSRVIAVYGIK